VPSLVLPTRTILHATPRARLITIDLGSHDFAYDAGQAVSIGLAGSPVRRTYSVACSPAQARRMRAIELLVQIDDPSPPDPHLERATPGTLLSVEGPFGSFGLPTPLPERHVLFVAGGTGIAPLRAILWELVEQSPGIEAALVYSARGPEDFAFRDELTTLASEDRLELRLAVTRRTAGDWGGLRGRIDAATLESMLRTPETRCLVCGPPALVADTIEWLRAAGVAGERISWESHR
jgi:ring-1,2-phenylacetyl-CoA epoxidase subunit PaaE